MDVELADACMPARQAPDNAFGDSLPIHYNNTPLQ